MSCKHSEKVAVIRGDGIGPEVVGSALEVLQAAGADIDQVDLEVGLCRWKRTGQALSEEDLRTMKECRCILFGAITTPQDPKYKSVLLRMRKELDLYANIRPFSDGRMDMVIVRENTEGLYSGIEEVGEEKATTLRVITRKGSERIAMKACEIASKEKKLTIVHKSNVLKSDSLFLKVCRDVAIRAGVAHEDMLVDAAAYNMVRNPERFKVIVTTNLFGDILSDEAAGIAGSLGLCASANIGERYALFEPIHGSAPDIAGKGIANPIGAIRSAAMMMDHLGHPELARKIEAAVESSLGQGIKTQDLGGNSSTYVVTREIVRAIESGSA